MWMKQKEKGSGGDWASAMISFRYKIVYLGDFSYNFHSLLMHDREMTGLMIFSISDGKCIILLGKGNIPTIEPWGNLYGLMEMD